VRLENSTEPGVIRIRGDRWFHEAGRRYLDACGGALFIAMVMNAAQTPLPAPTQRS